MAREIAFFSSALPDFIVTVNNGMTSPDDEGRSSTAWQPASRLARSISIPPIRFLTGLNRCAGWLIYGVSSHEQAIPHKSANDFAYNNLAHAHICIGISI